MCVVVFIATFSRRTRVDKYFSYRWTRFRTYWKALFINLSNSNIRIMHEITASATLIFTLKSQNGYLTVPQRSRLPSGSQFRCVFFNQLSLPFLQWLLLSLCVFAPFTVVLFSIRTASKETEAARSNHNAVKLWRRICQICTKNYGGHDHHLCSKINLTSN